MKSWLAAILGHPMFLITIGGALGANARYWVGVGIRSLQWTELFPLGTVVINITGSFLLALVAVLLLERPTPHGQAWYLLIGVGFCGAYTTFSTFEVETYKLLRENHWPLGLVNVLGSVLAGYLAVMAGMNLAHRLWPLRETTSKASSEAVLANPPPVSIAQTQQTEGGTTTASMRKV